MKALVYLGPGKKAIEDRPKPETVQSKKIDPTRLITHHFKLAEILDAYDTFGRAADTQALKVMISA